MKKGSFLWFVLVILAAWIVYVHFIRGVPVKRG